MQFQSTGKKSIEKISFNTFKKMMFLFEVSKRPNPGTSSPDPRTADPKSVP